MAGLVLKSFFTVITIEKAIENVIIEQFLATDKIYIFKKDKLKELPKLVALESFFASDNQYYHQIDVVIMEYPLEPHLLMLFMSLQKAVAPKLSP